MENPNQGVAVRDAPGSALPQVTHQIVAEVKEQIALLQGMVVTLLRPGVDFGRTPGTPQDSLWDSGAALITSAFNCYVGERKVLKLDDDENKVAACIEVFLISRNTGAVVATGIGAASTMETKYKYRWVENPTEWGFEGEAAKKLKKEIRYSKQMFRIPNPERSELLNTIVKIASKRSEVDAAYSLPGVASVLRTMFGMGKPPKQDKSEAPMWSNFWVEVTKLGMKPEEAHLKLGVPSLQDWLAQGNSLDDALGVLRGLSTVAEVSTEKSPGNPPVTKPKKNRDPSTVKTLTELLKACNEDFGLQPGRTVQELGYETQKDIVEMPSDCYIKIREVCAPTQASES